MGTCRGLCAVMLLFATLAGAQKLEYTTLTTTPAGSKVEVAASASTHFLSVKFTMAPCTALQPHVHNGSELAQVISGTINLGLINDKGELVKEVLTVGSLSQVPLGKIHYYYNSGCTTAVLTGAFDFQTMTQFILQSINLIPSEAMGYFLTAPFPKLSSPTPPFATDAKCLARCKAGDTGDSNFIPDGRR